MRVLRRRKARQLMRIAIARMSSGMDVELSLAAMAGVVSPSSPASAEFL
jgi:hypothetical protein